VEDVDGRGEFAERRETTPTDRAHKHALAVSTA
jgi:hypothetical protein